MNTKYSKFPGDSDIDFMQRAIELAKHAEKNNEVPIGAVVVLNNEIIGEGWNCPIKTHDPTMHAEIMALRNAANKIKNYRLVETSLYVTLEPCLMCVGAMLHARIKRLIFGARDPKTGAIVSTMQILDENKFNHKIEYIGDILGDDCGKILSEFFQKRRTKNNC